MLLIFVCSFGFAQTTNMGGLYVSPNTIFASVEAFDNQAAATFTNDGEVYFYSHFKNEGKVNFNAIGDRLVRFEAPYGNNPEVKQEITGTKLSQFYDVQFNNDTDLVPTYELHSTISVANEADFNRGTVQNDNFGGLFIFEDNAKASNMSDVSYVDGKVQKKGDDEFTYPIGDNKNNETYYRFATISAPTNVNHSFTAKYFFESPVGKTIEGQTPTATTTSNIILLDNAEFWTVTRDNGSDHVALTLSYDDSTTPADILAAPLQNRIVIAHWDDANKEWKSLGGLLNEGTKTVTTIANLSAYGIFTLARSVDTTTAPSDFEIYNGISSNGDGINDIFEIKGLPANNNVKIFNRWGIKVYETDNYNSNGNVFKGLSNGRATIQSNEKLPPGTYFYVITYTDSGAQKVHSGYLYITTD
jgi:gliding motility-associated-like protein